MAASPNASKVFDSVLVDKVVVGVLASAQALRNVEGGWRSTAVAWWRGGSSEEANEEAHRIEGWLAACGGSELNAVLLRLATYSNGNPNGAAFASLTSLEGSTEDRENIDATDELTRTIKAVKNRAPRHSRVRLLDVLCRYRHQELDTTSKALLLRCLQRLNMNACVPRAEAHVRRLLCSTKGRDLVRLKLKVSVTHFRRQR
jgi:hypothetical protein